MTYQEWLNQHYINLHGFGGREHVYLYKYLHEMIKWNMGGIAEIGVGEGKNLIHLNYFSFNRPSFGFDLFERQVYNHPNSGIPAVLKGALPRVEKDMLEHDRYQGKNISLYSLDSTTHRKQIIDIIGDNKLRMFSIDGGHQTGHVLNDLSIAEEVMHTEGVIIIDDFFSGIHPEVTEAVYLYLAKKGCWIPFLMYEGGFESKLFLCHSSLHYHYLTILEKNPIPGLTRHLSFHNQNVMIAGHRTGLYRAEEGLHGLQRLPQHMRKFIK